MNEVDERVDLSDLDLLDDGTPHARCTWCQPGVSPFSTFETLCGTRAVLRIDPPPGVIPEGACGECVALWDQPCRRCGL